MSRLVLVNTPTVLYPEGGRKEQYTTIPPYGLGYLATAASQVIGRANVTLIDAEFLGLSPAETARRVQALQPDLIGVNVFSPNYHLAKEVITQLQSGRQVPLLVGGPHAVLDPQGILADPEIGHLVNLVCTGEGEETIQQLLADSGPDWQDIPNLAWREGDRIIETPQKDISLEMLNRLIIDRTFFGNSVHTDSQSGQVEGYILSSRGCPFDCSFCAAKEITHRRVRLRSRESLMRELQQLRQDGVNYVRFIDDLLLISEKRIVELASIFRDMGLSKSNFGFEANGRANIMARLAPRYWDLLSDMGLNELEIGIESGSPRILKMMNKRISPDEIKSTVARAVERGIGVKGFLMVGYPTETREDLEATVALVSELKDIGGDRIRFSPVPVKSYPGTQLSRDVELLLSQKGILLRDDTVVDLHREGTTRRESETLSSRTRYNAMHTLQGQPIALSELTEGADTELVLRTLARLILISAGEGREGRQELREGRRARR